MVSQLRIGSPDEDELWLFHRILVELQEGFGHSEEVAVDLVNGYYRRFTDPAYCDRFNMSAQGMEFFFHEEAIQMADRIQYYEFLGHQPNEWEFIQWHRSIRLPGKK